MKRSYLLIAVLLLVAVGVLVSPASDQQARAQDQKKPTVVPGDFLTPVPTPPDGREIAILTLLISSAPDGKLEKVELQEAKIVAGYAPNVLNRPGDWTVEVIGDDKLVYGVSDPRRLDVLPGPNDSAEAPHQTEFATETTWELVVPLYLFEKDLRATEIHIYDAFGDLVFSTPVDRVNWKKQ